ncbi:MAG: hypothetical protein KDE27_03305, partial [Planctomycetes bacterium]|nr:hypothetical protein [Planctomycetota bacterium]
PAAADLPHHAGGVCDRRELRPGSYLLTVLPEEPFGERLWLPVEVREGGTETLRVELAARRELRVTVCRRGDGTPVAGADIALAAVHPADRVAGLALDDPILAVDEIRPLRGPGPVGSIRGVAVGRTDERGDVTLRAPAGHALVLGVRSPHAVSRVVALDAWPAAGESLRVEVDAGAVVRGQVRPLAFVERFGPRPEQLAAARADFANGIDVDPSTRFADDWPSVVLRRAGAEAPIVAAHVDCDGRFELAGVPAGSYEVWLEAVVRSSRRGGSTRDLGPVASITVDAAEAPAELALDAGPFVPARVRGTFFVDGEPWRGVAGFARLTARGNAPVVAERDPGGAYESQWLLPGRYLPFAHFEVRPGVDRYAYDLAPIDVGPGEEVEVRAVVTRRRLELVLRDAAGAPVADVRIRPEPIDRPEFAFEWRFGERTDAAGRIVLDPAPPGRLRLRAFALGEDPRKAAPSIDLGEIGADRREVELRWPLAAAGGR